MKNEQTLAIYHFKKILHGEFEAQRYEQIKFVGDLTKRLISTLDLDVKFAIDLYYNNQLYELLDVIVLNDEQIKAIKGCLSNVDIKQYNLISEQQIIADMKH